MSMTVFHHICFSYEDKKSRSYLLHMKIYHQVPDSPVENFRLVFPFSQRSRGDSEMSFSYNNVDRIPGQ